MRKSDNQVFKRKAELRSVPVAIRRARSSPRASRPCLGRRLRAARPGSCARTAPAPRPAGPHSRRASPRRCSPSSHAERTPRTPHQPQARAPGMVPQWFWAPPLAHSLRGRGAGIQTKRHVHYNLPFESFNFLLSPLPLPCPVHGAAGELTARPKPPAEDWA